MKAPSAEEVAARIVAVVRERLEGAEEVRMTHSMDVIDYVDADSPSVKYRHSGHETITIEITRKAGEE